MFTVNDFIVQYNDYSDKELLAIHLNIEGYSKEAQAAVNIVIEKRGGIDSIQKRLGDRQIIANEMERIEKETAELGIQGFDAPFIKNAITSSILSVTEVNEVIDKAYGSIKATLNDKQITNKTIGRSIAGGLIASIVGGILWGLQLIYSGRAFSLLVLGLILLCYTIIKAITKLSIHNNAVLTATFFSIILAALIGQVLYAIVGYMP